jgi:Flp pilus assembly protein TadD
VIEIDDLQDHLDHEEQERALASAAATSAIRDAHLAMAERHARRAAQLKAEEASDNIT